MSKSEEDKKHLPNPLKMLTNPKWAFASIADAGFGYGRLFFWLGLEFFLLQPLMVTSGILQAQNSLSGGLAQLWRQYLNFALEPALWVFGGGIVLYYLLRQNEDTRIEIYPAASVTAHTWLPHVGWVCLGAILTTSGLSHPILPQASYSAAGLTPITIGLKALLEFGPSCIYFVMAYKTLNKPSPSEPITPAAGTSYKVVLSLSLLLVGASVYQVAQYTQTHWKSVRPIMVNDPMPDFRLTQLSPNSTLQLSDLAGKVALIDFWATWCGPCVISMPYLDKLYQDYKDKEFTFVSINTQRDDLETVREFIQEHNLHFPVYTESGRLQSQLRVQTYPTAILIDKAGLVRKIHIGAANMITLRKDIDKLLQE